MPDAKYGRLFTEAGRAAADAGPSRSSVRERAGLMSEYTDLRQLVTFAPRQSMLVEQPSRSSPFSASWSSTVALLAAELRAHGARRAVMEIDVAPSMIRLDGLPSARAVAQTPGVVLSFEASALPKNPQLRYEASEFFHWQDNVRAIALSLHALRLIGRYGVVKRGEQYVGNKQLAAGEAGDGDPVRGRELIAKAGGSWRKAAALAHPDVGGGVNDFRDVIAARDAARAAV
jgi:hypothetical protein